MPDRFESVVYLGKVSGESWGYKRPLKTYIHIALRRQSSFGSEPREQETTDHRTVVDPLELSVTYSTRKTWATRDDDDPWVSCGAGAAEAVAEITTREAAPEVFERIARLIPWHLNGMSAGCDHQTVEYESSPYGRRPSLSDTLPCPVTGYRYGSAWLLRELPDEIVEDAVALGAVVPPDRTDPAVIMAEAE